MQSVGRPKTIDTGQKSLAGILNLIRENIATTRPQIEKETELGRAVVTDRVSILTKLGLVEYGELGQASGGRAPRRLQFCVNAGLILVAVLENSAIGVGLSNLSGELYAEHHEAIDVSIGPDAMMQRLFTLFDWLIEERGDQLPVWSIGVAVPSPIRNTEGSSFEIESTSFQALSGWGDFPLVEHICAKYKAPVWVRDDVQAMTVGEQYSGRDAKTDDLLFVKLGKSVGAGFISNGQLHRGADGIAGLIGHAQTDVGGDVVCHCGKNGCLEVLVGSDAIERSGTEAAISGQSVYLADIMSKYGVVTVADVGDAARMGDTFSAELLTKCGRMIGENLSRMANLLNPALIVLGGHVAQTGDILLAAVREAVYRQSHPLVTREMQIVRSQMGGSASLVGVSKIVVEQLFTDESLRQWVTHGVPRSHPKFLEFLEYAQRIISKPAKLSPPPDTGVSG
ncbi:MAG: ROK family protein [Rhizobiaceae bacterium]|nr:ROK family protein [Rhizobiaceae bacterium]